jgi:Fic family protein
MCSIKFARLEQEHKMKIPTTPPDIQTLIIQALELGAEHYVGLLSGANPAPSGKYRHWDVLRHLAPPEGLTPEQWWLGVKVARRSLYRDLPLTDRRGRPFRYAVVDPMLRMLHEIDQQATGAIKGADQVTDPQTRDTYLIKSLLEEAITSSQLEGASTTREVAKDMLQRGRPPRDRSEQMISNNYRAMEFIRRIRTERLTPGIVSELHRILTTEALDDPTAAGRLRHADETIHVVDEIGRTLHIPPDASELADRMARLCEFANATSGEPFIHPVVRAILLHLWLAYDHPFVDGNGRTARALFYWSMASQGYWLCEYISISRILRQAPGNYVRAFLYTETDDNDATYFVLNQLRVTVRAIHDLHEFLRRKAEQLRETRRAIEASSYLNSTLNHRQLALVNHAIRNPRFNYTIESHRRSHNISYQTARTDLLALAELGLLDRSKAGKAFVFLAPPDLRARTPEGSADGIHPSS